MPTDTSPIDEMRLATEKLMGNPAALAAKIRGDVAELTRKFTDRYPWVPVGRSTYIVGIQLLQPEDGGKLSIGSFCAIADGIRIFLGGEHRTDWLTTFPFTVLWEEATHIKGHPRVKGDVRIGNDCWIGNGVTIISGVTIGDGAAIGCNAVVTKDVPPYGIAAGNPAKVVRKRFDDATVEKLLRISWWNWDDAKIKRFLPLMLSTEVQAFIEKAESEK